MASSSSSSYLPDYTTLWAKPFEPHFPHPPSPPRRATSTANDSRRQAHEQTLRQIAHARSVYHHASGSHLPSRRSRRYRADHRAFTGLDDGAIKEQVKLQERESGYAWNGSGTTEQEEREIEEEEDLRMQWVSSGRVVEIWRPARTSILNKRQCTIATSRHSERTSFSTVGPASSCWAEGRRCKKRPKMPRTEKQLLQCTV